MRRNQRRRERTTEGNIKLYIKKHDHTRLKSSFLGKNQLGRSVRPSKPTVSDNHPNDDYRSPSDRTMDLTVHTGMEDVDILGRTSVSNILVRTSDQKVPGRT